MLEQRSYDDLVRENRELRARLALAEQFAKPTYAAWNVDPSPMRVCEIDILHRISELTLCEQPLANLLQDIIRVISTYTGFPVATIEFYTEPQQMMECVAAVGLPLPHDSERYNSIDQTFSGLVVRSGQALILPPEHDFATYADPPFRHVDVQTFVCVPMQVSEYIIGTVALVHTQSIPIDPQFLMLLQSLANFIAVMVARKRAEERILANSNERIETETRLQVALTKYQTLFDSFPLGITVSDATGQIVESNRMASRLLGIGRDEHYQRQIDSAEWRIIRPDGTPMSPNDFASVRALHEQRVVENVEMGIVMPDGHTTWINVTAAPIPLENYGVVITYSDITARKEVELALRMSEERFLQFAAAVDDVFWISDPINHRLLYINPAYEHVMGRSCAAIYANYREWIDAIHPDDQDRVATSFFERIFEGTYEEEFRIVRPDGTIRWLRDRGFPIRDIQGNIMRAAGIAEDITERRRAAESERQAHLAAEEAIFTRDKLISMASHDLRNPLSVILGQSQLMMKIVQKFGAQGEDFFRRLGMISDMANQINGHIEDMLDVARLRDGQMLTLNMKTLDIVALTTQVVRATQQTEGYHTINLSTPTTAILCQGDQRRLARVIENLLSNAIAYSPEGGLITMTVTQITADTGKWAFLQVQDTGIGIPTADLPYIFERFHRGANVVGFVHGTGLGLASVQQIVAQHAGYIEVTSTEGRGSTFSVYLPALDLDSAAGGAG